MSNVVNFSRPAERARSRNREQALAVIVPQLRRLLIERGQPVQVGKVAAHSVDVGTINIMGVRMPDGLTLLITDHGAKVFSASLDTAMPGKYLGGTVHVMSWKRGDWESRLFMGAVDE